MNMSSMGTLMCFLTTNEQAALRIHRVTHYLSQWESKWHLNQRKHQGMQRGRKKTEKHKTSLTNEETE